MAVVSVAGLVTAAVLLAVLLLSPACGGPAPATPTSESPPGVAALSLRVEGEALVFDLSSLEAPAGSPVMVTVTNDSVVVQHNWALVPYGTKNEVALAGFDAGPSNGWLPVDDQRLIAATELLEPGTVGSVSFQAPAAGAYQFVCTVPGHYITMFGDFTVTP